MLFLLEIKKDKTDVEDIIVSNLLDKEKHIHSYVSFSLNYFFNIDEDKDGDIKKSIKNKNDFPSEYENAIPIGNIPFINAWLEIFKGIKNQNPIEIPPILRTDEFLKRKYSIVKKENIPTSGYYFIKDASELKVFSYNGNLEYLFSDETIWDSKKDTFLDFSLQLDKSHYYQVSEVVNILSEYRVYIINGEIENIQNYNGDPTLFPDINLIRKANLLYSTQKDYPKSYSLDIMITPKGTSIIEIHNFTSLGLYSTLWGTNLLYAYRDGIDYLVNYNTNPIEFNNF